MQADEAKVKALESIFGGQDITASVIRTVLTSNENKFDDAVDSLLNMTTTTQPSPPAPAPAPKKEEREDPLLDRKEREKIKTLEGMFGKDLSNSVICTVLQSNKGELVDAVDTLLNMTSLELDPSFGGKKPTREDERQRQEQELRDYEEFKRLQIKLQEEEARAMREQQQQREEEARRKAEDEKRSKEVLLEQERILREYEEKRKKDAVKREQDVAATALQKAQEEAAARAAALKKAQEEQAALKKAQEEQAALKKAQEEQAALKRAQEEEAARKKAQEAQAALKRAQEEEVVRQVLEAARRKEEAARAAAIEHARLEEEAKKKRALAEQEAMALQETMKKQMAQLKEEEERLRRIESQKKEEQAKKAQELAEKEALLAKKAAEEERRLALLREKEAQKYEAKRRQVEEELRQKELAARRAEEEVMKRKFEEEERAHRRRMEEEEKELALKKRIEQEKEALAAERAALEKRQKELLKIQEEQRLLAEAQRAETEALAAEFKRKQAEALRAEEERRAELELLAQRVKEAEERERLQREEAEARRIEEEHRRLEKERQEREAAAAIEEEKKKVYELMAASAVFIPPKVQPAGIVISANASGDSITCTWDIPEGNAAPTNWLGLYPVRQNNVKKYVQFVYTNGASSGEHVFRAVTPGKYNVRFFATRAYENAVISDSVHVGPMATIMPQVQGEHVLVYYTLSPLSSTPTREWIGIYEASQRRNKLYLSTAYGNAEGQVMMKAPRTPGVYEVRLFATGAVYNESTKAEFVIEDNDCVNVESASVMAGNNVTINWILRTLEPSTGDWIGLYRADEANNSNYLSCTYTNGASVGTATVPAPKEVGVYEFRLFSKAKGKYTTHRTSLPLTVV